MRLTENAYGNGPVEREITPLRGLVRPGNSGGPLVDGQGRTVATVFAALTHAPPGQAGGFAVPNSVVARDLARARHRHHGVGSGVCTE
jgi:S1-C subfamily serine protease